MTPNRIAHLITHNCSAHGTVETLPSLANVTVSFLPRHTTSKMQSMDAGVIEALKVRYRRLEHIN